MAPYDPMLTLRKLSSASQPLKGNTIFSVLHNINPFNLKYIEWYNSCLDLEQTIQVCRGERIKCRSMAASNEILASELINSVTEEVNVEMLSLEYELGCKVLNRKSSH